MLTNWLIALALALVLAGLGTTGDDLDALRADASNMTDVVASTAARLERGAQARRNFAARQICGPEATPVWTADNTLTCVPPWTLAPVAAALSVQAHEQRRAFDQQAKVGRP